MDCVGEVSPAMPARGRPSDGLTCAEWLSLLKKSSITFDWRELESQTCFDLSGMMDTFRRCRNSDRCDVLSPRSFRVIFSKFITESNSLVMFQLRLQLKCSRDE